MSETARLADQIRRAFEGEAWHGDSVLKILEGVDAKSAAAKPVPDAHSIWEILLHVAAWDEVIIRRARGNVVEPTDEENFPAISDASEAAWQATISRVTATHDELIETVGAFPDSRLQERVPGKEEGYHDFYHTFSGIVQHELYHAGQIALLKKFK
jgi:uncharacterized damage-inducible protein DinB